jgi:hypothetical protein
MCTRILQDASEIQLLAIVCRLIRERTNDDILSVDQSREAGLSVLFNSEFKQSEAFIRTFAPIIDDSTY